MTLAQAFGPLHEGYDPQFVPTTVYVEQADKVWFVTGNKELTESVSGKTIVESMDQLELVERDGKKYVKDGRWYVEGTYQRSDVENANKRKYPKRIWQRIIANAKSPFMENVRAGGVVGHIEHPGDGRTDGNKVALKHLDFKLMEDGRVWGRSVITTNTPGRDLQALTEDGVRWGVSSRGSGSVGADGTVSESDFQLETFDMVMRPSTPGAYPTVVGAGKKVADGVKEGVEPVADDDAVSLDEAAGPADISKERVASLLLKLETNVIKVTKTRPAGAPIVTQMLDSLKHVQDACKGKEAVTGAEAVEIFAKACKGHFLSSFAPLSTLVKKYNLRTGYGGEVTVPDGLKKKAESATAPATNESQDDAAACISEATTLAQTDVGALDETEAQALTGRLLKSLGRVNGLDRADALPSGKAHDLRDWLANKLSEIAYGRPTKRRAAATVMESDAGTGDGKSRTALFERTVSELQQRVTDATNEAADQRELAEALQARAETAEAALAREQKLREAAVQQMTRTGQALSEKTRQLDTALATIEDLTAADVADPVEAAVAEAVQQNPQLESYRSLLERSDTPEEVFQHAELLATKAAGSATGTGRARTHAPRPTLPMGGLVESIPTGASSSQRAVQKSSPGAKAAGAALGRMNRQVQPT